MDSYCVVVLRNDIIFGVWEMNGEQFTNGNKLALKNAIFDQKLEMDYGPDERFEVAFMKNVNGISFSKTKELILEAIKSNVKF
jgi:hypothetical protein